MLIEISALYSMYRGLIYYVLLDLTCFIGNTETPYRMKQFLQKIELQALHSQQFKML